MAEKPTIRHPRDIRHLREGGDPFSWQTPEFTEVTMVNSQLLTPSSRHHLWQ